MDSKELATAVLEAQPISDEAQEFVDEYTMEASFFNPKKDF